PTDSVAQFRVMTNNYDAQYGRQAGATINMSIKSGTKDYHGNVYDFFRNTVLEQIFFKPTSPAPTGFPHITICTGALSAAPSGCPNCTRAKTGRSSSFRMKARAISTRLSA